MRRLALLTVVLLLGGALPASAKMPPFDMEMEPRGDTIHIEVMISNDYALNVGGRPLSGRERCRPRGTACTRT
jgi:hypothetical protein